MAIWQLTHGATPHRDGTRFQVWAPHVETIDVVLRSGDPESAHPLRAARDGTFVGEVAEAGPGTEYMYRLNGTTDRPDPVSRCQPQGVHGPSRVVDPAAFDWTDHGWRGVGRADLIVYELHVGTFSPAGNFAGVIGRLPYLRDLGVTAIELMPVAQFPGTRNWGYDGVHPFAPQDSYGGPEGLRHLVDAAHASGLAVILDVVYNHLGPEGNYLAEFGPYFTDRYHTPWGSAVNFDGPDSDEVRRYFVDNARYWVSEFHIDGLRLDAVHAIYDFSARHILRDITAGVHEIAAVLDRAVHVIAESDLNDPRLVRPLSRGGFAMDAQWCDDFHHAVHAKLTGERAGYYGDFGSAADVAKALADRYVLDGRYSSYRRRRHGAPAGDVPADRFIVFIQNHDQVGNRAAGERLGQLTPFTATKLAAALVLLAPFIPLLFMGEEWGATEPFLYFVSHGDTDLNRAVREGRRREFASFGWEDRVPDPVSERTFNRSRLNWEGARSAEQETLLQMYRDLIRIRRSEPALRPGAAGCRIESDARQEWITLAYAAADADPLVVAFNLSDEPRCPAATVVEGRWRLLFTTAQEGKPSDLVEANPSDAPWRVRLAPMTAALYRREAADTQRGVRPQPNGSGTGPA